MTVAVFQNWSVENRVCAIDKQHRALGGRADARAGQDEQDGQCPNHWRAKSRLWRVVAAIRAGMSSCAAGWEPSLQPRPLHWRHVILVPVNLPQSIQLHRFAMAIVKRHIDRAGQWLRFGPRRSWRRVRTAAVSWKGDARH